MNEKIVTSQAELDAIPVDYSGRIIIKFGTPAKRAVVNKKYLLPVEAYDNSSVEAYDNSSVCTYDNSSVRAYGNSSVCACNNSSVCAYDNSSVRAYDNSSVCTYDNSSVRAYDNSSVCACNNSSVEAYDNSSVCAYGNSSVCACNNSSVCTHDNSSVEAYDNSSVEAYDNSSVCTYDNSSVEAHDNSSVEAHDNSSVRAYGNSQVVDAHRQGNIMVSGNARIVYNPDNIADWASANGITITDGKIRLYKAVHKRDGKYVADWDNNFTYTIGAVAEANGFTTDPEEDCGQGIHMATLGWSAAHGRGWGDIALLELETDADEIVVPLYETGKVRAPKALVIREVPLEEAGIMGKILAKRRENG
jgi:hypothetical protein